ncbi:MAG: hypothetical protein R3E08_00020 [Thiotrichaceae bacterium]
MTLAGHTHGGQIALSWIQEHFIPSRYGTRYARGHIIENGKHLFVTSMVLALLVFPFASAFRPEIVIITLTSEN